MWSCIILPINNTIIVVSGVCHDSFVDSRNPFFVLRWISKIPYLNKGGYLILYSPPLIQFVLYGSGKGAYILYLICYI